MLIYKNLKLIQKYGYFMKQEAPVQLCYLTFPIQTPHISYRPQLLYRNNSSSDASNETYFRYKENWSSQRKISFFKAIFLGFGVAFGYSLYDYVSLSSSKKHSHKVFPTLCAASSSFDSKGMKEDSISISGSSGRKGNRRAYNFIADVVERVSDGVVYIDIKDHRRRDFNGKVMSVSNGSGFVVHPDGLILTNAHVVANKPRASSIVVRLSNGKEYEGKVEDLDLFSDLALVRINLRELTPLVLGSSKDVRPGEFVVALGSPLSLSNTITSGVVSSIGRASKDLGLRGRDIDYIQTDAAITFGNSGGPLVNLDGEVIGINSMKVTSGISFAIPVDHAKDFLSKAEKKNNFLARMKSASSGEDIAKRRYLGITMLSLTPEIIMQMQQKNPESSSSIPDNLTHGILVWKVVVGSPAYYAGLEPGDIVTHINGHAIESSRDVYSLLEGQADLSMVVVRKGQRYSVTVAPEA